MNVFQLVTRHLYFGVDAMRLRDATERVLMRVRGQPPERAVVGLDTLAQDFRLSVRESLNLVDQMVQSGLLEPRTAKADQYAITDKFRLYAQARIVEPLPRSRAQLLLTHMPELAAHFNRTASRNKYEIEALAVYGPYMSREPELADLPIGVTGRRRAPHSRPLAGRATTSPTAGHEQIRKLFEELSSFVHVKFYRRLQDIPRPFSVIFRDEA
jgi:hypothetical protein